jgi:hypothetical protein
MSAVYTDIFGPPGEWQWSLAPVEAACGGVGFEKRRVFVSRVGSLLFAAVVIVLAVYSVVLGLNPVGAALMGFLFGVPLIVLGLDSIVVTEQLVLNPDGAAGYRRRAFCFGPTVAADSASRVAIFIQPLRIDQTPEGQARFHAVLARVDAEVMPLAVFWKQSDCERYLRSLPESCQGLVRGVAPLALHRTSAWVAWTMSGRKIEGRVGAP